MSNIHLRELPPMTLEILKTAAAANGRSLNAELVRLLTEEAEHIQRTRHPLPAHRQQRPNGGTILPTVAFGGPRPSGLIVHEGGVFRLP